MRSPTAPQPAVDSVRRRSLACRAGLAVTLLSLLLMPGRLEAAGDEYSMRGDDLQVTVSSKWAGGASGGYYPIRVLVQNRGVDVVLTFEFNGGQTGVATVRRTVAVAQNATVRFTLPVPCVGQGAYGQFRVYRNGRLIEGFQRSLSIADPHSGGTVRPALLVISPTDVDFDPFESAVASTLPEATSGGGGGYGRYGYYGIASENHERIEPNLLPEEWIAYSGLDFAALSLASLEKMSTAERFALLKWVQTGGTLIVYEVGAAAGQSTSLNDLLDFAQHAATPPDWQPADPDARTKVTVVQFDDYGNVMTPEQLADAGDTPVTTDFVWPADEETFARRDLMLGRVVAFRDNPFPGSPHDWHWFLKSLPPEAKNWTIRNGLSARYGSDEFLKFLIPSVRGVPVTAFLLLITLFTIVIGPLNYIFLWKRRRLYLLVLTIPLIALGTSLALFAYSAVAHGFSTKSRARTLTYVDQDAQQAVTLGRIALFAGLAPADGLEFSADTSVMPVWPENFYFQRALTDWSEQQNLRNGWLDSRTRTQFYTIGHREERGRLEIAPADEGLQVTNGFEWPLQALLVNDRQGETYYAADVPVGGSVVLKPDSAEQRQQFRERLQQYPLASPDLSGGSDNWFNWDLGGYYGYDPGQAAHFSSGQLERLITRANNQQGDVHPLPPGSYVAVLPENPGIELGVARTHPQATLHVLMGRY